MSFFVVWVLGMIYKRKLVMVGILQSKVDICAAALPQNFDWIIAGLENGLHTLGKAGKSVLANRIKQRGLVLKVEINCRGRIFNLLGNASHRHVFVALVDE